MKNDTKRTLTPKLRFPEFRQGPGWEAERMENLYSFMGNNALSRDKLNYESGAVKNIHYGDIHTKFQALFDITKESVPFINMGEPIPPAGSEDYCVEGDMIFADASEDTNDVGKSIEVVRLNGERLLSGQHTILARRKDGKIILGFGGHLFRSRTIRVQFQKEAQGTKVYAISATRLANVKIAIPAKKPEQQKIADCLSSLDELIAAEGWRLEALRAHKQGLMQQLFPRDGETRPRLRFPEFRSTPEWRENTLGDICDILNNRRVPISSSDRKAGPYPYYGASGIVDFVDSYIFDERLLLVGEDGAKWGAFERTAFIAEGKYWVNNHAHVLRAVGVSDTFLENYLTMADIGRYVTGNAPPKLTLAKLKSITVPVPPTLEEQTIIAETLSSLDKLIFVQAQKLDALTIHKKGLMQQLFPSPEGD
jgi:type I restriction enzyme, S subunit